MAKRFTDTGKWDKPWFRQLNPKLKCAWFFILDRCDHAGVWEPDLEALSFFIGQKFTLKEITESLGQRIKLYGRYLVVTDFPQYQYGHLNPSVKVHASVLKRLDEIHNPKVTLTEGLGNCYLTVQDKDKDKDKDNINTRAPLNFEAAYKIYPLKKGKERGLKICRAQIKTGEELAQLIQAIENYCAQIKREGTEPKYIKHFSTFMGSWREFLDADFGRCSVTPLHAGATPIEEILKRGVGE